MNEPLPDKAVFLALFLTVILVFIFIFSTRPHYNSIDNSIEWKDSSSSQLHSLPIT